MSALRPQSVRRVSVSRFRAHLRELLYRVSGFGESVTLTRHGKPVAMVIPCPRVEGSFQPGRLAGTVTFRADIVSPLPRDTWEAARDGTAESAPPRCTCMGT